MIDDQEKFKIVLKTIKTWAKLRMIHSRNSGFLNGIAWSILAARVWIKYNHLSAWEIIKYFFLEYTVLETNERIRLYEWQELEEELKPKGAIN